MPGRPLTDRTRRGRATSGRARAASACVLLVAALAACTTGTPTAPESSAATTSSPASPSPTPSASPTPTPSTSTAPATVALTGQGVGTVVDGTPDALPALEALLGPADSTDGSLADCGAPNITFATWGKLWVSLDGGALNGWQLNSTNRPAFVTLPFDVDLDAPYSQVTALVGAVEPQYLDNYQVYDVTADGITWWFADIQPDSPVVLIGHGILGCG